MSTKIVIERKFKEPVDQKSLQIIDEIRIKALRVRGYIGGETLVNLQDDREVIVISAWSAVEDWKKWYETNEWKELERQLVSYLAEPVRVRALIPGADYEKKFA